MREIRIFAPCKLNLYLDILEKRPDGFHNIETIFEKIDLRDEIIIKEKGKGLKVKADAVKCGQGKENLVYKAVQALFKEAGVKLNLDIEIKKRVPVSAGLGGGSSDAASSLRAINEIFKLGISAEKLFSIAADIGKDAPFFMLDAPFSIGKGAGEILEPLDIKYDLFHVVVKPELSLSTRAMYARIDRQGRIPRAGSLKGVIDSLEKREIGLLQEKSYNAFENTLWKDGIHINKAKALLSEAGARKGLLSGSGPSVFSVFKTSEEAEKVFENIRKIRQAGVFLARTSRGDIWK